MGFAHGFSAIVAMPVARDVNLIQRRQQFLIQFMQPAQFSGGFVASQVKSIAVCQIISQPQGFWLGQVRFPRLGRLNATRLPARGTCAV